MVSLQMTSPPGYSYPAGYDQLYYQIFLVPSMATEI